jgi:hypothetical protein
MHSSAAPPPVIKPITCTTTCLDLNLPSKEVMCQKCEGEYNDDGITIVTMLFLLSCGCIEQEGFQQDDFNKCKYKYKSLSLDGNFNINLGQKLPDCRPSFM